MPQDGRLFANNNPEVGTIREGQELGFAPRPLERAEAIREEASQAVEPQGSRFKTGFEPLTEEERAEDQITTFFSRLIPLLGRDFAAPNQRLRKEARERRKQQLSELSLTLNAITTIRGVLEKTPADMKQEVVDAAAARFSDVLPGLKDLLPRVAELPDADLAVSLFGDAENAEAVLTLTNGDSEEMLKLAADEDFMDTMRQRTDERNRPIAVQKLADARTILEQNLPPEQFDNLSLSFGGLQRINEELPDQFKFTNSELATLRRNPNLLLDFGITPPEIQTAAAKTEATEASTQLDKLQNEREEAERGGDTRRVEELGARINKLTTIVGRTPEDVAGKTRAREEAKAEVAAQEDVRLKSFEITNLSNLIGKARKLGENATGLKGLAIEGIGGFLGQINKDLEKGFADLLGSSTPEQIQAFRTQARTTIAQNISTVSGEESSRFSEMERRVTETTLRVLETGASKTQIVAALSELLKLKVMLKEFSFSKLRVKPRFDLETREGIGAFIEDSRKFGLSDDDIVDMAIRVKELRRAVKPNVGRDDG